MRKSLYQTRKTPECLTTDFFTFVHGSLLKILKSTVAIARQKAKYSSGYAKVSGTYVPIRMFKLFFLIMELKNHKIPHWKGPQGSSSLPFLAKYDLDQMSKHPLQPDLKSVQLRLIHHFPGGIIPIFNSFFKFFN